MSSPPHPAAAQRFSEHVPTQPAFSAGAANRPGLYDWLAPLALFVLVTALYLPSISNGFVFDDHLLILQQSPPDSVGDLLRVFAERHWPDLPYYRPVARFTMVAQKMLHGEHAAPYHAFNAGVMGLVAAAAYLLLRTPTLGVRAPVAWLGALLVGVHPIASSCVYPICSGRETSLPALFMLLTTSAWLRPGPVWRTIALVALGAAFLSKEQAIVMPVILVIADLLKLPERSATSDPLWWFRRYTPVVTMVLLYLGVRFVLFRGGAEHKLAIIDQPILPLLTAMYATQVTFLPFVPLTYEPTPFVWFSWWRQALSWSLVLAIGIALARSWSDVRNAALFWLAWIFFVNLPTANLLIQEACFDERYELLSLVGVVGLMGGLLSRVWDRGIVRLLSISIAAIAIIVAASVSYGRAESFRDDFAFFRQWKATDPEFDFVGLHLQAAGLEMRRNHFAVAADHARAALEAAPDSMEARLALAEALFGQGQLAEAQVEYEAVLERERKQPAALAGTARILAARGDWSESVARYRAALSKQPISAEIARQFAWLLATCPDEQFRSGSEAVRWATIVVQAGHQEDARALDTLGAAHAEAGDFTQATKRATDALQYAPPAMAVEIRQRLALYRSGQAFHEATAVPEAP